MASSSFRYPATLRDPQFQQLYGPGSRNSQEGNGKVWTAAVHPGLVDSQLGARAEIPCWMRMIFAPYMALGGSMDGDKGSWTSVFCAASPYMSKEQSGAYFQRIADPGGWQSGKARDMELATRLEEWTSDKMEREGWMM